MAREESADGHRGGWPGTLLWALLIVASVVLIFMGLWRTTFFIYAPEPALIERSRVGGLYILAGSAASLVAAGWSIVRRSPQWVAAFVPAPAVLVGGAELVDPNTLIRHLAAVVAFPFAFTGLYAGLPPRKSRNPK
jgi:hypothetical protein